MTIRRANLGNTDWSDGQILYAADLNDTFGAAIIRASESSTDTSEYSASLAAEGNEYDMGYSKTFTVPDVGAKNVLVGFRAEFEIKNSASTGMSWAPRFVLTNNTTGKVVRLTNTDASTYPVMGAVNLDDVYSTRDEYAYVVGTISGTTHGDFDAISKGSTYTVTIKGIRTSGATQTAYIKNITLTAYWTGLEDEVIEGWA